MSRPDDLLLAVAVQPSRGGQEFIRDGLSGIQQAATSRREMNLFCRVSVDGGINDETGVDGARAGADTVAAGTSPSGARDLKSAVTRLRCSESGLSQAVGIESVSPDRCDGVNTP
jgi:ribulose-phosphate 3-epimerase